MDDLVRRLELRDFLVAARSRLAPEHVGLPATERRRVPGLRREEVAELAGVTPVWYRWFESGRDIRVSEQFLRRLSAALRFDAREEVTLYRLALPGLYCAERTLRDAHPDVETRGGSAPAIAGDADIDAAATAFAVERERFLSGGGVTDVRTRARIVRSWRRSQALQVDAERRSVAFAAESDVALAQRRERNELLLRAAADVVKHLADRFTSTGYAIALTDGDGCLLRLDGELHVRRRLAKMHFEPGGDWSESAAGTNAIGTALADRRPLQLMGAEHFCDGWRGFTCTAAPIRDPDSGEVIGVLDITGHYRLVRRHLIGVMLESALEIEERLSSASTSYASMSRPSAGSG
jgi:transcriptional regulator with XRE-family HTH domain